MSAQAAASAILLMQAGYVFDVGGFAAAGHLGKVSAGGCVGCLPGVGHLAEVLGAGSCNGCLAGAGHQGVDAVGGVLVVVNTFAADRAMMGGIPGGVLGQDTAVMTKGVLPWEMASSTNTGRVASRRLFFVVEWLVFVAMVKAGKFFMFLNCL